MKACLATRCPAQADIFMQTCSRCLPWARMVDVSACTHGRVACRCGSLLLVGHRFGDVDDSGEEDHNQLTLEFIGPCGHQVTASAGQLCKGVQEVIESLIGLNADRIVMDGGSGMIGKEHALGVPHAHQPAP